MVSFEDLEELSKELLDTNIDLDPHDLGLEDVRVALKDLDEFEGDASKVTEAQLMDLHRAWLEDWERFQKLRRSGY